MAMNRIQFQPGWSMPAFLEQFGTEPQAEAALEKARWPQVFRCPRCGQADPCVLHLGAAKPFQCQSCRLQPSLSAGTWCQNTHLALPVWFLAIYLVSPAKTGLSALGLMRQLGISYPTAWLLHHKLRQARAERDAPYTLGGQVQVDAAYLGGELAGSKAGRGSENQVPFVAAVALTAAGQAVYTTMTPVPGFTRTAIAAWAKTQGCSMLKTLVG